MAFKEVTNLPSYKAQATLDFKYAPVIQRGKFLHEQTSKSTFPHRREAGHKNLDLWLDGSLYPRNPATGKHPRLNCLKDLLEFLGEGEDGLLGYVKSLEANCNNSLQIQQYVIEILHLKDCVSNLRCQVDSQEMQLHEIPRLEKQIACLEDFRSMSNDQLHNLQSLLSQEQLSHKTHVDSLVQAHSEALQSIRGELAKTKASLKRMVDKFSRLQKTPLGYRSQVRKRRDLSTLSQTGGHAKALKRLTRTLVGPETVRIIQERNIVEGRSGRLHGDEASQVQSGRVFASILSQKEVETILNEPKLSKQGVRLANQYMQKIGEKMRPEHILETCDRNAITHNGYSALYKRFNGAVKTAGQGLRVSALPNPHQLSLLRREMNDNLEDLIGQHSHIDNTLVISLAKGSKKLKTTSKIELNSKNTFFTDIEKVQQTMVKLYGITPEGTLKF